MMAYEWFNNLNIWSGTSHMMHFLRICISFIGKLLLFYTSYFQRFEEQFEKCILPCRELLCSSYCDFCMGRNALYVSWPIAGQYKNAREGRGLCGYQLAPLGLQQPYWIVLSIPPPFVKEKGGPCH